MLSKNKDSRHSKHNKLLFRLAISFAAAQFISIYGHIKDIPEMLFKPGYYYAVLWSFWISFILIESTGWYNRQLDQKYPWELNWKLRLVLQLAGIISLWLVAFFGAAIYYGFRNNINIFDTGYLRYLFPQIAVYVVLINASYNINVIYDVIGGDVQEQKDNLPEEDLPEAELGAAKTINAFHGYVTENDIALIYRKSWATIARTADNLDVKWPVTTIRDSFEVLPADQFLLISGSMIVHKDLIARFTETKGSWELTLKPPFNRTYHIPRRKVSQLKAFGEKHDMPWASPDLKKLI